MGLFKGRGQPAGQAAPTLPAPALVRILELVRRVGEIEHPEEVLDAAVEAAIDLTEAERGWILIQSPEGALEVAAVRDRGGRRMEDPLTKVSRTIVDTAIREDRALCVDEARQEAGLSHAGSVKEMRLRAVLCVPFQLGDARGVFYLDNRFAAGVFDEQALQMLRAFTGPVAMILRHSALENRLAETNDSLAVANRDLDRLLRDRTADLVRLEGLASHPSSSRRSDPFPEILGEHPSLVQALESLGQAALADVPVLLRGESGTGKDLAVRSLHRVSSRSQEPFVPVSLAGLTDSLLEAELFGVRRGAFTGADEDRDGLLAAAGGGTLFLDGLESLPPGAQAKLLRVLEDGSYRPVGGGEPLACRARVVTATRIDLAQAVADGAFREDLYYRVRVVEIVLPPLRQRRSDIPLLLAHFVELENRRLDTQVALPDADQRALLHDHDWPGNVRELAAFATRWVTFGGDLPEMEWERYRDAAAGAENPSLQSLTDRYLLQVLEEAGGNKAEAARRLGISRRTLYNRLERLADET